LFFTTSVASFSSIDMLTTIPLWQWEVAQLKWHTNANQEAQCFCLAGRSLHGY
jgi:hypothetical protein